MTISYPLALPSGNRVREIAIRPVSAVSSTRSPFTFEQQVFAHQGQLWQASVALIPMKRVDAAAWRAFFLALNIRQGTFLMGQPVETAPQGTWAGTPKVLGAHAAGATSIAMDGFSAGATVKGGDQFQTGSGSSAHLHEVAQDATADGSGLLTIEIWPRLRAALADDATFVTNSPQGLWRLDMDQAEWVYVLGQLYRGISFSAIEAL